jgi:hypothetical protein
MVTAFKIALDRLQMIFHTVSRAAEADYRIELLMHQALLELSLLYQQKK